MKQLLSHLRQTGTPSLYRKHASLFFQGEVPRHAVIILDGAVKAYTISAEGEETIVDIFGRGAIIPNAWLNDQTAVALFNYDAINDVRVLKVRKHDFLDTLAAHPECQQDYIELLMKSQASLLLRITGTCQPRAIEKICYTLYYLVFRYGVDRGKGRYEIDLKLTHSTIASLIGQTRESTTKNLTQLKRAGILTYQSSIYTVDKPKLESFIGEDTFRELSLR